MLRELVGWASVWELQNPLFAGVSRCGRWLEVWVSSWLRAFLREKGGEGSEEDVKKSFRREGKGRDSCSPEI